VFITAIIGLLGDIYIYTINLADTVASFGDVKIAGIGAMLGFCYPMEAHLNVKYLRVK